MDAQPNKIYALIPEWRTMYVPTALERVFVTGTLGEYLVVAGERFACLAQLTALQSESTLIEDVPFAQLEPIDDATPSDRE